MPRKTRKMRTLKVEEQQALHMRQQGYTYREIAEELHTSEKRARDLVLSALRKL